MFEGVIFKKRSFFRVQAMTEKSGKGGYLINIDIFLPSSMREKKKEPTLWDRFLGFMQNYLLIILW